MPDDATDPPPFEVIEPPRSAYLRSSANVSRLVLALVVATAAYLPLSASDPTRFATVFGDLLATAPRWIVSSIVGVVQLAFLVPALLGFLVLLGRRRFRRVGRLVAASAIAVAGVGVMSHFVGTAVLTILPQGHRGATTLPNPDSGRYGVGSPFPTTLDLAVITAAVLVEWSHWSTRWRRLGAMMILSGIVAQLGVNLTDPTATLATVVIAAAAAQLVQTLLGRPNLRPTAVEIGRTLQQFGYTPVSVQQSSGFDESTSYVGFDGFRVHLDHGRQLFVKVVSRDSWSSLTPRRIYRAARFRDPGDQSPFRSLRSGVEHEALAALKAHADGVPTPRVALLTDCRPAAQVLAFDNTDLTPIAHLSEAQLTPDLLDGIWGTVASLSSSHTVHRRLNGTALMADGDGTVVVVGFGAAEMGVLGPALATDTAEVLALTSAWYEPRAAVAAALGHVGPDALVAALPRLQPLALTPPTRAAVKESASLDELRAEVQRVTGASSVDVADLERIKPRSIATVAMMALALWAVVPQFVGNGAVWSNLADANWWWMLAALGLSGLTYFAAAVALDGSVLERLPLLPNVGAQIASSFVAIAAPGGALAVTGRFLQKRGVAPGAAVAAISIDTVAGGIVHVALVGLFALFAGTSGLSSFSLPSASTLAVIGIAVAVGIAAVAMIPWSRRLMAARLLPATRRSLSELAILTRQPVKMLELFGGSLVITMSYILALVCSVQAFGADVPFTRVAIAYLLGAAVASIAPTPGAIGAMEAALIAGLTSAGMASAGAAGAVLLFRLATFWLPLLPGWIAFTSLQRTGDL